MQKTKYEVFAVLLYLLVLLSMVVIDLINTISFSDLAYLFVVICGIFKFFLIINNVKE